MSHIFNNRSPILFTEIKYFRTQLLFIIYDIFNTIRIRFYTLNDYYYCYCYNDDINYFTNYCPSYPLKKISFCKHTLKFRSIFVRYFQKFCFLLLRSWQIRVDSKWTISIQWPGYLKCIDFIHFNNITPYHYFDNMLIF